MRVIQISSYGSPYAGSFVSMLQAALDATRRRGWHALAVLPVRARERDWFPAFERANRPDVVLAPEAGRLDMTGWLQQIVASAPGPTILHAQFNTYDVPVAVVARRLPDVRAIWHFQTVLSESRSARLRNRVRFTIGSRYVDRLLCVSPHIADGLLARGAPAEKLEYFPNAVDVERFAGPAAPAEKAAARAALGLAPEATVLLHIGRDWHLKGGDVFLDTFQRLAGDRLVALLVRGGDTARQEVERRGLADRVLVLEGTSDVRRLHAAADLMLATSRGEGHPFAVLEALSSGLPIVATDIAGHAMGESAPPGLAIAPLRAEAIAAAAQSLLDRDAQEAAREGERAHEWVRERFSTTAWATRLMAVYDRITDAWGAGGVRR